MIFEQSNAVINDIWKQLLIIKSDIPINLPNDNVIIDTNEYYEITYYTDGLFRTFEENGKYINWYLINSKVIKELKSIKLEEHLEELKKTLSTTTNDTAKIIFAIMDKQNGADK